LWGLQVEEITWGTHLPRDLDPWLGKVKRKEAASAKLRLITKKIAGPEKSEATGECSFWEGRRKGTWY